MTPTHPLGHMDRVLPNAQHSAVGNNDTDDLFKWRATETERDWHNPESQRYPTQ